MRKLTVVTGACCCLLLALPGRAHAQEVRFELTLAGGRTQFRSGDPIKLRFHFVTTGAEYTVTEYPWPSPADRVTLTPRDGVYPWSADLARFDAWRGDWFRVVPLKPEAPVTQTMTLNEVYRFDHPGHYTLHITTQRVSAGAHAPDPDSRALELTSNDISFDVLAADPREEERSAAAILASVRASPDINAAQEVSERLKYLAGDGATAAKLSLYLHPVIINGLTTNVTDGLWIARDRQGVVSALEKAVIDPAQISNINMDLLGTLVYLKASLVIPYDGRQEAVEPLLEQLSAGYVHQIARSIPGRTGEPGIDAARIVFASLASRHQTGSADFAVAREYLVAHFADVDPNNVDWLLNVYGEHLRDPRMIPVLKRIIADTSDPVAAPTRVAAEKQLALIGP
jgi:hypothetical protein